MINFRNFRRFIIMDRIKNLENFIKSDNFCNGLVSDSAYSTAWAARVRNPENYSEPAFMKSLEWLRKNQNEDGCWANSFIYCEQERILCTMIALITLKQWNYKFDEVKIKKAEAFIRTHSNDLLKIEENEIFVAFEMLIISLAQEIENISTLINEKILKRFSIMREQKIEKIKKYFNKGKYNQRIWYFNLEALDGIFSQEEIEKIFFHEKSIGASFSATCFALYKKFNLPCVNDHVKNEIEKRGGALPTLDHSSVFDIVISYGYLIFINYRGIPENKIEILLKNMSPEGFICCSDHGMIDADTIAHTIFVMNHFSKKVSIEGLMTYWNGEYFETTLGETNYSLSTNVNCLLALKCLPNQENSTFITEKLSKFLKEKIGSNRNFTDKWHISKYYSWSRAILAFEDIDDEFAENLFKNLILEQKEDGGWGYSKNSTSLESSYCIIAICHWLEKNFKLTPYKKNLERAYSFLIENSEKIPPMWIMHDLYSIVNCDRCVVLCSLYKLKEFLK